MAAVPTATAVLQGVLWNTPEERQEVETVLVSIQSVITRQLECWTTVNPVAVIEIVTDGHCWPYDDVNGDIFRENITSACLLYLLYACRMGLAVISLYRLLAVFVDVPPTQLGEALANRHFQMLAMSDRRMHAYLFGDAEGAQLAREDLNRRSIYWEAVTLLHEEILLHAWMRSVDLTQNRRAFHNDVLRLVNRYCCADDLLLHVYRWWRCIRQTYPALPVPRCQRDIASLECLTASHLSGDLRPGAWAAHTPTGDVAPPDHAQMYHQLFTDAGETTNLFRRVFPRLGLVGEPNPERLIDPRPYANMCMRCPRMREELLHAFVHHGMLQPTVVNDLQSILDYQAHEYGYRHLDPMRRHKENLLSCIFVQLEEWVTALSPLAADPAQQRGEGWWNRLLGFMQGVFWRRTGADADADA